MKYVLLLFIFVGFIGCTDQQRAKSFGGTATIDLPAGKKLVSVSWKETNLWYCTRDRRQGEPIERYEYKESSSLGLVEGDMIIIEH